jgi:predicted DsbA family dithiol-disulfide isomerase
MTDDESDPGLVVCSDYVCPFCYLGKASLESYLEGATDPPAVEYHQFDLRGYQRGPDGEIDPDVDTGKDEEYFERARRNVERLADEYDVEMDVDLDRERDSWNAQQFSLFVQRKHPDRFPDLNDRLFEAASNAGITGVPTFEYGEHVARGAVPPAQLRRLVEGY